MSIQELAKKYCQWNGQTGTSKQIEKVIRQFRGNKEPIERFLKERGISIN